MTRILDSLELFDAVYFFGNDFAVLDSLDGGLVAVLSCFRGHLSSVDISGRLRDGSESSAAARTGHGAHHVHTAHASKRPARVFSEDHGSRKISAYPKEDMVID